MARSMRNGSGPLDFVSDLPGRLGRAMALCVVHRMDAGLGVGRDCSSSLAGIPGGEVPARV